MNRDDPAYVAMMQARIAIGFGPDSDAIFERVMAAPYQDSPLVDRIALKDGTILFNRDYVAKVARTPAGRAVIIADITELFLEP